MNAAIVAGIGAIVFINAVMIFAVVIQERGKAMEQRVRAETTEQMWIAKAKEDAQGQRNRPH